MSDSILVTYATRYGSTREVAEKVAATLRESGAVVDLQPAGQVKSVDGYRAVVLGAPLYMGSFLKDAQNFLTQHQAALTKLPVVLFVLGPTRADAGEWKGVREELDKMLAEKYPWIKPASVELFGGKYDPAKLGFFHKLIAILPVSPLRGMPASDVRDWDAIRAWASGLLKKI